MEVTVDVAAIVGQNKLIEKIQTPRYTIYTKPGVLIGQALAFIHDFSKLFCKHHRVAQWSIRDKPDYKKESLGLSVLLDLSHRVNAMNIVDEYTIELLEKLSGEA